MSDLPQGGFIADAADLQRFADLTSDKSLPFNARIDALKQIEMRCHVKWLGDLYLPLLSQKEWWDRLEKLRKSTAKPLPN